MEKKNIIILVLFIALIVVGYYFLNPKLSEGISLEEAKTKVANLIALNPSNPATVKDAVEESGLYKITVVANGEEFYSYISKDGKQFFPQAIDLEEIEEAQKNAPKPEVSAKSDKPAVELFVMSHCPFGTQIEKGILPVLTVLDDKIDFELKFCDYAMHDKLELDEQTLQHCIKEQDEKQLLVYLNCFLEAGNSAQCLSSIQINNSALQKCKEATDDKYKIAEQYNNKETWQGGLYPVFDVYKKDNLKYKVGGSPALIINGETIDSDRDSNSLLAAICSGFNNPPTECEQELSSARPSPGFGFTSTTDNTNAVCN